MTAYKGYLIITDYLGRIRVEKNGQHISWANSIDTAKGLIDSLVVEVKCKYSSECINNNYCTICDCDEGSLYVTTQMIYEQDGLYE